MRSSLYCILSFFLLVWFGCAFYSNSSVRLKLISNEILYKSNQHAAFTTISNVEDTLFIVFREACIHNPTNKREYGHLNVIKNYSGLNIDTLILKNDSMDLRDPFLININGNLRLYCFYIQHKTSEEGQRYSGTIYSDYIDGSWSKFKSVNILSKKKYILWKIRCIGDKFYSIGYNNNEGPLLFQSSDGIEWLISDTISKNKYYTEGDLIDNNGSLLYVIRNEDYIGAKSLILRDNVDSIFFMMQSVASPELLKIDNDHILCAGREYDFKDVKSSPDSINMSVFLLDTIGNVLDKLVLPTGRLGDKGYPSFQQVGDTILMTYYYGKNRFHSDIYLSKILINGRGYNF